MAWTPTPGQKTRMDAEIVDEPNQLADIANTIAQLIAFRDDKLELDTINYDLLNSHIVDLETYLQNSPFADALRTANVQGEGQVLISPTNPDFVLNYLPYNGGSDVTLFRGATPCTFTVVGKTLTNIVPPPPTTPGALYNATYSPEMRMEKSFDAGREDYPLVIPPVDDGSGPTPVMTPDLSDITNWRLGATPDIIAPFTVGLSLYEYSPPDPDTTIEKYITDFQLFWELRENTQEGTRIKTSGLNWVIATQGDQGPKIQNRNVVFGEYLP